MNAHYQIEHMAFDEFLEAAKDAWRASPDERSPEMIRLKIAIWRIDPHWLDGAPWREEE